MGGLGTDVSIFERIICLINEILEKNNCYVSPDGNVYKRHGDTYTVLTTIDIFIGMMLVPGCDCNFLVALAIAENGAKLKGLLMSPFQRLIHNRYPKIYQPENEDLQKLAKTARCEVKKIHSLKIELC